MGLVLVGLPVLLLLYAYLGYPLVLLVADRFAVTRSSSGGDPAEWPMVTVSIPAYNEEEVLGATLEALLAVDYPEDRLKVVVVSDASTDRTEEIVRAADDPRVRLVRLPVRSGKTAAEEAALGEIEGEIVVNMDASILIRPGSLKPLVRALLDPTVGLASGRDVSVAPSGSGATRGEEGYVGYEMWVRSLESRVHSIVGASGCFYAIRRELHATPLPAQLSRDFAAALVAREKGFRAVSVDEAVCEVPRSESLPTEFGRKIRTMERGLHTLWYKRHLLNPFRYGLFAWMLSTHKLCRWMVLGLAPAVPAGALLLAAEVGFQIPVALFLLALVVVAGLAYGWPSHRRALPRPLQWIGYGVLGTMAAQLAWWRALRGKRAAIWEPTRRIPRSARSGGG